MRFFLSLMVLLCWCLPTIALSLTPGNNAQDVQLDTIAGEPSDVPEAPPPDSEKIALPGLEDFVDGAVGALMEANDVPGVTISIVHDGKVALAKGYGYADVAFEKPVDPDKTLFRIGSISKTFTWTAVMQLVEEGKLDLDTDVNEYLTQFQIPATFDEPITMRHIMSHTTGFEDLFQRHFVPDQEKNVLPLAVFLERSMPARFKAPGGFHGYSNWATALAGLIVANQSNTEFSTYVERQIFNPLGMGHSTFREPIPSNIRDGLSAGFRKVDGAYIDIGFEYVSDAPAGAMSSTATDMAKFMLAHLNDGKYKGARILTPETARKMRKPLYQPNKAIPATLHGFFEKRYNGRFSYGHVGAMPAFVSEMALMPAEGGGIFVSTNSRAGFSVIGPLFREFFDRYYPHPSDIAESKVPTAVAPRNDGVETAVSYAGTYRILRRPVTTFEAGFYSLLSDAKVMSMAPGELNLTLPFDKTRRMIASQNNVFRDVNNPDVAISFHEMGKGEIKLVTGSDYGDFEKIGFLESGETHRYVLGIGVVVMLGTVFGGIWAFPKWLAMNGGEKVARAVQFIAVAVNLAFICLLYLTVPTSTYEINFTRGLPNMELLLSVPLVATIFGVIAAVMVVPAWINGYWSWLGRIRYTVVAVVLLVFAWSLNYLNLLGPWYV
ncbi:MAG: serine hydrolase domain-containing protein [Pseudomonadota bacterium]